MTTTVRHRIESGLKDFGHLLFNQRWIALVLTIAIIAGLISQLPKLEMDTSTEGFLHEDDPTLMQYNAYRDQFGRDELVVLAITGPEVFNLEFLSRLKALHEELESQVPHLDDITSLINARNTRGAEGELIVEDLLERWPENEAALANIKQQALANPLYKDLLLSEDGSITTIVIKSDAYSGGDVVDDVMAGFEEETTEQPNEAREYLTDAENSELVNAVREITLNYHSENFRIHLAGGPVVSDVLKRAMQTNMGRFTLSAVLLIGIVLALLFRRVSGVALPLLVVILTLLSTLGLMGAAGIPFKLPTQILPSFLLAVGVGASVHILAIFFRHLQQTGDKGEAIGCSLGHSGLAVIMTSLTTAAGLASFAGAEVAPISDLGIIAAIGVLISLLYTLVLLPALLAVIPIKPKRGQQADRRTQRMDRLLTATADFSTGRSKLVLIVSAALLLFGLAGASQVKFSHMPFKWLPTSEPARQASDFIDEHMKGASSVEVIVDTGRENGLYEPPVMQGLEKLKHEVEAIRDDNVTVGKTLSVADILKETNQALNENRDAFYRVPDNRELIAQELLLFENSGSDDLEDFVDSQFSMARFTGKMPWADAVYLTDFLKDLKQRFQNRLGEEVSISVTGMNALLGRTMHATIVSMTESYLYAAGVITIMMILLIGDLRIGLVSMIPNLTPIILTVGLMGWLGLPMDLFTMLIGSIAIGLAVDDTIHFMHNYRRYHHDTGDVREAVRQTLLTSGRAMLVTTVVLSLGFFIYLFSTLNNLINFGLLTGFTIIMALLSDFFLAPALMTQMHKARLISDDSDY